MKTTTVGHTSGDPHLYLRRQTRWSPYEIGFWVVAAVLPFLFPTYLPLASQIAVAAMFAVSLDLILGYAGIISLGHAVFFGIGAYTAGLISKWGWGEPFSGLVIAGLVSTVVGYLISFIIVRVQHLALLMITLGLGLLSVETANSLGHITGGADGLQGVSMWPLFGEFEFGIFGYVSYPYTLIALFAAVLVGRRLVHSPFGLSLRGIRENFIRMPAIGADNASRLRRIYTIAACMAGLAGALLTQTTQTASLEVLGFQRSADVAVMLILGGTGRLYGGIIGAIIFMMARDIFSDMNPQYWYFWIGLLLIVVVLFEPRGILGALERLAGRLKRSAR